MNKKLKISLWIIISIILLVLLLNISLYSIERRNYDEGFSACIDNKEAILNELMMQGEKETAQTCFDSGGCYVFCGSGCGLPQKPEFKLFKLDYIKSSQICPAVCTKGCIYP